MRILPRRVKKAVRSPKFFVPTPKGWIVVPIKPLSSLLVFFFFSTTVFFFLRSDIFFAKNLEFETQNISEEALIRQIVSENVLGRSLFSLDEDALEEKLRKDYLYIRNISLKRNYPDGLKVFVEGRKPLAIVSDGGEKYLVDEEGLVFASAESQELPEIVSSQDLSLGDKISQEDVLSYLFLLSELSASELLVESIHLSQDGVINLKIKEGPAVVISSAGSAGSIELVKEIIYRYRLRGITLSKLDLRFSKPIVVY